LTLTGRTHWSNGSCLAWQTTGTFNCCPFLSWWMLDAVGSCFLCNTLLHNILSISFIFYHRFILSWFYGSWMKLGPLVYEDGLIWTPKRSQKQ
jgi:hypothetical protein